MRNKRKNFLPYFPVLLLALVLSGCAGKIKNMQAVPPERVVSGPAEGKSLVIFMRPSGIGFAIQSSVFEVEEDKPKLVGIVTAKSKVSYQVEPGEHLFMVVGESADYMSAELAADKTYYALVTPRLGVWKARFSLKPVHGEELNSSKFNGWVSGCKWVEKTLDSDNWANSHMASIQSKHSEYYGKWMAKEPSERPKLLPGDGQ
jgi:hypothetical protein